MLNKIKREKQLPEIKGIFKHYRITHALRNPKAPLPPGRQLDELVFHVRFVNGDNGKPVKADQYLTYDVVAKTRAFQEYASQYLTPRIGRVIGVYPGSTDEVVSFADTETVRLKHEKYMESINKNLNRKRKSYTMSMDELNSRQESSKKIRYNDTLSMKSEPVTRQFNERFPIKQETDDYFGSASVHSQYLGSRSSKSSLITATSVSTLRSVFEPLKLESENNNRKPIACKENVSEPIVQTKKRPAPPPPIPENDESFHSLPLTFSGSSEFNESFGADGTPYNGHRPSGPIKNRNSFCCLM